MFDRIRDKDVVAWNSMIIGYALHGFSPTNITFIGVLGACGHAGLVEEGWSFFNAMRDVYEI